MTYTPPLKYNLKHNLPNDTYKLIKLRVNDPLQLKKYVPSTYVLSTYTKYIQNTSYYLVYVSTRIGSLLQLVGVGVSYNSRIYILAQQYLCVLNSFSTQLSREKSGGKPRMLGTGSSVLIISPNFCSSNTQQQCTQTGMKTAVIQFSQQQQYLFSTDQ